MPNRPVTGKTGARGRAEKAERAETTERTEKTEKTEKTEGAGELAWLLKPRATRRTLPQNRLLLKAALILLGNLPHRLLGPLVAGM